MGLHEGPEEILDDPYTLVPWDDRGVGSLHARIFYSPVHLLILLIHWRNLVS